jgi:hypothetical protein
MIVKEVDMFRSKKISLISVTFIISIILALSAVALGGTKDKRGRGKEKKSERFFNDNHDFDDRDDRRERRNRKRDKKAEKFINGHDARDGRFDGRGPRARDWDDRWMDDDDDFDRREIRDSRRFRRPPRRF